jgi:hypothetical protein
LTGYFARWGTTKDDDPKVGMLEILDLEISTICEGVGQGPCKHCYKSNTPKGENMTLDTYKQIFNKLPQSIYSIALGIGDIWSNPDLFDILRYTRYNDHNPGVVPNITTNGFNITDQQATDLAELCGGIAVSVYHPKDVCYNAVKQLTDAKCNQKIWVRITDDVLTWERVLSPCIDEKEYRQMTMQEFADKKFTDPTKRKEFLRHHCSINIHQLVAEETFELCQQVILDAATDPRLEYMKAIVFLTLKPKGKRNAYHIIKDIGKYRTIINLAIDNNISWGFDSCSAPIVLAALKDHKYFDQISEMSESCESNRFSGYANVDGIYWHCSFTEDQPGFTPVSLLTTENFMEVWRSDPVNNFRNRLINQDNGHIGKEVYLCPVYDLYDKSIGNASPKRKFPINVVTG